MQALTDAQVISLHDRAAAGDDKAIAVQQALHECDTAFNNALEAVTAAYTDALPTLKALAASLRALQAAAQSPEVGEDE